MPPRRIYEHSGPVELVLEGENLTPDTLKLYHNGVLYTPLESSDTYAYYLLGDNGLNKIILNGKYFFDLKVSGIVMPEDLRGQNNMRLYSTSATSGGNAQSIESSGYCINYPHMATEDFPYFLLTILLAAGKVINRDEFVLNNCTINNLQQQEGTYAILNLSVIDTTKPAYITYQGFIIAVFNYTT